MRSKKSLVPLIFIILLNSLFSLTFINYSLINAYDMEFNGDISSQSSIQNHIYDWYRPWGSIDDDFGNGIANDSFNNLYIVGAAWNDGTDQYELALIKYDSSGSLKWETVLPNSSWGEDIAIDSANNIYIAGFSNPQQSYSDFMILKYNSTGEQLWEVTLDFGYNNQDLFYGIEIDKFGDVCVSGYTVISSTASKIVLFKYNSNGTQLWNATWGGQSWDYSHGLTIDSNGNIYVVGATSSYGVGRDIIIIKYNRTGSKLWNVTWAGTNFDYGYDIEVDSKGNLYIVGTTEISIANTDIVLAKFDSTGIQVWNRTWGGSDTEEGFGIIIDQYNDIYITGMTYDVEFHEYSLILFKYNSSGNQQWQKFWHHDAFNTQRGRDLVMDSSNNIYIIGDGWERQDSGEEMILLKFLIDTDGDNLSDNEEVETYLTNPNDFDSDDDGLNDGDEINLHSTDPNDSDSDDDGLNDGDEINLHSTDPNDFDSDNDGFSDGEEVAKGTNPNDFNSNPETVMIRNIIITISIISISAISIITLIFTKKKSTRHKKEKLNYQEIPDLKNLVNSYAFSEIEGIRSDFKFIQINEIDKKIKNQFHSNINSLVEILESKGHSISLYQIELLENDCYNQSKPLINEIKTVLEDQEKIRISKGIFGTEIKDTKDLEELERFKSLDEKIDSLLNEYTSWKKEEKNTSKKID